MISFIYIASILLARPSSCIWAPGRRVPPRDHLDPPTLKLLPDTRMQKYSLTAHFGSSVGEALDPLFLEDYAS